MKQFLKKASILFICATMYMTAFAQKITATNANGNIIEYKVLSATDKTVIVTGRKDKLPSLVIPETVSHDGKDFKVVEINNRAFRYNVNSIKSPTLKTVELPATLVRIGGEVFADCRNLESCSFPSSLKEIGYRAFYSTGIENAIFQEGLERIDDEAFAWSSLQTLSIPNTTKVIGKNAFAKVERNAFSDVRVPYDYTLEHIPLIINEHNCENMGISKGAVTAYLAQHPRSVQQPQVVYMQTPEQKQELVLEQSKTPSSDVDVNLPDNPSTNENTFAVIFANENYQEEAKVDYALNDGEMMRQYCHKLLGLPEDNIHIRKDATRNNLIAEVAWMRKVAEAYKGSARFIIYYAGHGIPDEKNGTSYLLPVDGNGSMLETGYSLQQFYKELGEMPSDGVIVFMDACFSGSKRGDGMLASARGVAIKAKPQEPNGKMIVFSAAQGDETAYPLKEKEHGLFTYFLLKKLKDTSGNVTLGELGNYICDQVSKKSIVTNGKSQTPVISPSSSVNDNWKTMRLNN